MRFARMMAGVALLAVALTVPAVAQDAPAGGNLNRILIGYAPAKSTPFATNDTAKMCLMYQRTVYEKGTGSISLSATLLRDAKSNPETAYVGLAEYRLNLKASGLNQPYLTAGGGYGGNKSDGGTGDSLAWMVGAGVEVEKAAFELRCLADTRYVTILALAGVRF